MPEALGVEGTKYRHPEPTGFWEVLLPGRTLSSEGGRTEETEHLAGAEAFLLRGQTVRREMEVSFMISCKGCTPWQGLLLTASLLSCWYQPTTAQITIELPPNVFEGDNVLLQVHNLSDNLLAFAWYKGVTNLKRGIAIYSLKYNLSVTGPVHSGRETVYSNGSLLLQSVTHKDTGFYTFRTISRQAEIVSVTSMYLHVHTSILTCAHPPTSVQPTIESVPPRVAEGASVLLLVHNLQENLLGLFWYKGVIVFKNHEVARHMVGKNSSVPGPAHSGRETMYSNGSLLLHNITLNDIGFYTLRTLSRDLKMKLTHVQLQVDTSLSACCNPLTSAPLTIEPVPQNAAEGESVLLLVHNLPEDLRTFSWYKGVHSMQNLKIADYSRAINYIIRGPAYRGREMVYTNGSLLLQGITEKDAGFYTLQTSNRDFIIEKAYVQLHVKKPVSEPFLRVTDTTVPVQGSVVFTCLSADTGISIRWVFNNQSLQLTERMTLSPTKCGLSIDPVRREDAGQYKCEVSNTVSSKTSLPVRLAVVN